MSKINKLAIEFVKKFKRGIILVLLTLLAQQIINGVSPYIFGQLVEQLTKKQWQLVGIALLASLVVALLRNYFNLKRYKIEIKYLDYGVVEFFQNTTFKQLLSLSIGQHINTNSGVKESIITKGEGAVIEKFNLVMFSLGPTLVNLIVNTIFITVVTHWSLFFFMLILALIEWPIIVYVNRSAATSINEFREEESEKGKHYHDSIRNIAAIKIQGKERSVAAKQSSIISSLNERYQQVWNAYVDRSWYFRAVPIVGYAIMSTWLAYLFFHDVISIAPLLAGFSYIGMNMEILRELAFVHRSWTRHTSNQKLYEQLLDAKTDLPECAEPSSVNEIKNIQLLNVSYQYSNHPLIVKEKDKDKEKENKVNKLTIEDLTYTFVSKKKTAIVGPSGTGKSTLISLLVRAYDPTAGEIRVNGVNLKDIDLNNYLSKIGIVHQSPHLFDASLRENILFGLPDSMARDVSDEELDAICHICKIDSFYDRLEKGFDTQVGESGVKLSGGECQRVALARALIKKPQVLILDEATSHLDVINERYIKNAIDKVAAKGLMVITIAHRLSTIKDADEIVVMNNGTIAATGTHDQLMKNSELYQELINSM